MLRCLATDLGIS